MMQTEIKQVLLLWLAIALGTGAASRPNIIVFLTDDQDKESIGRPYGELVPGG